MKSIKIIINRYAIILSFCRQSSLLTAKYFGRRGSSIILKESVQNFVLAQSPPMRHLQLPASCSQPRRQLFQRPKSTYQQQPTPVVEAQNNQENSIPTQPFTSLTPVDRQQQEAVPQRQNPQSHYETRLKEVLASNEALQEALEKQHTESQATIKEQQTKLTQLQNQLGAKETQFKFEKEELIKKVRVLLTENEKSTNLVQALAQQEEDLRMNFQDLQKRAEVLDNENGFLQEKIKELQDQQTTMEMDREVHLQVQQYQETIEQLELKINFIVSQNRELNELVEEKNNFIQKMLSEQGQVKDLEVQISQLLEQNNELNEQLIESKRQMECIQELDERVEEVISENNQYKQLNDELHKQLALQEEQLLSFKAELDLKGEIFENLKCQMQEKEMFIESLQKIISQERQKVQKMEMKLSVMSEDNIRLTNLLQNDFSNKY